MSLYSITEQLLNQSPPPLLDTVLLISKIFRQNYRLAASHLTTITSFELESWIRKID